MSNLKDVNLQVCYEVPSGVMNGIFMIDAQYFSDAENLNDLDHLADNGITRVIIESFGRKVLEVAVDLENYDPAEQALRRERLIEIQSQMPQDDRTTCQICEDEGVSIKFYLYGDRRDEGILKLSELGIITTDESATLITDFSVMSCDDDIHPKAITARAAATALVGSRAEKPSVAGGAGG